MINGIGVVAWGVGGIEAEAAMLGQPVYFLTPDVVGFEMTGRLREGVTATDLVLTVTEILRQHKVVGKFVEFFGEGTRTLALPDRATVANMAPEYGATMGFFPVDEKTIAYFEGTGRTRSEIDLFEAYFKAQGLFGIPKAGAIDYSQVVQLDLGSRDAEPGRPETAAGPHRAGAGRNAVRVAVQQTGRRERIQPGCRTPGAALRARRRQRPGHGAGAADPHAQHRSATGRAARSCRDGWQSAGARGRAKRSVGGAVETLGQGGADGWQWRHPDRGDHQLHQHLQPQRAAGGRFAGQEGGRRRPQGPAAYQDLAGARLAHRHRVPDRDRTAAVSGKTRFRVGRVRLHHLHRQLRRPDARAQQADRRPGPGMRRGALGQPQFRGAHPSQHQGQLPGQSAAGRGLCDCRHHAARPDDRAGGPGQGRARRLPGRHLADQRRDPCAAARWR